MRRVLLAVAVLISTSLPSFAKQHDLYPMPCDRLWVAVKDTLGNSKDFRVLSMYDESQQAAFIVVGNLTTFTDTVVLTQQEDGCQMKLRILQVGGDNSDERMFRNRLKKSMEKLQAAKPDKPAASHGQQ